ncbi:NucA/NucB deoxyribonuclease domain-containing protein [Streptomyces flavovirens]|uniref:NucA/NucB deoxyribonuclease domain-containing protein n=1 Tax=Streptomyces flavovirens TaxID=52258 RepID=UPI003D0FDB60
MLDDVDDAAQDTYGAAGATYAWAQWNLPDKWGLYSGKPLTRALDGPDRRRHTCGDLSSVPFVRKFGIVPTDTCDEFPFASTQEGGTDGDRCAEIVPLLEDGEWKMYEADPARPVTRTEPCVRAMFRRT